MDIKRKIITVLPKSKKISKVRYTSTAEMLLHECNFIWGLQVNRTKRTTPCTFSIASCSIAPLICKHSACFTWYHLPLFVFLLDSYIFLNCYRFVEAFPNHSPESLTLPRFLCFPDTFSTLTIALVMLHSRCPFTHLPLSFIGCFNQCCLTQCLPCGWRSM